MLIKTYIETRIRAFVFSNHIFFLSASPVIMLSISHFQCSAHKRLIPSPDITCIYSSCVVRIKTLSCPQYIWEMWSMIHKCLNSDITVKCFHFHMDWCIIYPVDDVVKVVFFWCGFVFAKRSAHTITQQFFFLLWHFRNSLTRICPRLLLSRYFYQNIHVCMYKGFLLAFPGNNLCTSAWRYVMFTKTCLLWACDIHIDVCYLLYDMWLLLYVFSRILEPVLVSLAFYIDLELSLSGGIKSITIVRASSIFMYVYNKLALPDSLRLFYQSSG